jgi:hypothetical protein
MAIPLKRMQRLMANAAVTPSAIRGGRKAVKGVQRAAIEFLCRVDLARAGDAASYAVFLDQATEKLRRAFPRRARHWGRARKCVNIFMRACSYNFLLRKRFKLRRLDAILETPLDRFVADGLNRDARRETLPRWRAIIHLTPEDNAAFQAAAAKIARRKYRTYRAHLDLWYWRAQMK